MRRAAAALAVAAAAAADAAGDGSWLGRILDDGGALALI